MRGPRVAGPPGGQRRPRLLCRGLCLRRTVALITLVTVDNTGALHEREHDEGKSEHQRPLSPLLAASPHCLLSSFTSCVVYLCC